MTDAELRALLLDTTATLKAAAATIAQLRYELKREIELRAEGERVLRQRLALAWDGVNASEDPS